MKAFFFLVVSSWLIAGCELMTRDEIKDNDQRKSTQEEVTTMQKSTADQTNRQQEVEYLVRDLNGRVEALNNQMEVRTAAEEKAQLEHDQKMAELEHKVALLQDELTKNEAALQQAQAESAATAVAAANATAAAADAAISAGAEKRTNYDLGEEAFAKKDWKNAILKYQKYRDQKPPGKNVLDATYKIGVCFQELGMKDEARSFYEELASKHPTSPEAKKAKFRLKKL